MREEAERGQRQNFTTLCVIISYIYPRLNQKHICFLHKRTVAVNIDVNTEAMWVTILSLTGQTYFNLLEKNELAHVISHQKNATPKNSN